MWNTLLAFLYLALIGYWGYRIDYYRARQNWLWFWYSVAALVMTVYITYDSIWRVL
jgi:hypothetical protein